MKNLPFYLWESAMRTELDRIASLASQECINFFINGIEFPKEIDVNSKTPLCKIYTLVGEIDAKAFFPISKYYSQSNIYILFLGSILDNYHKLLPFIKDDDMKCWVESNIKDLESDLFKLSVEKIR